MLHIIYIKAEGLIKSGISDSNYFLSYQILRSIYSIKLILH